MIRKRRLLEKTESFASGPWSLIVEGKEGLIYRSREARLLPLLDCIDKHYPEMLGATVLDKMVGRAAALLCVYARVGLILTPTVSEPAVETLKGFGVPFVALEKVERIMDLEQTGPCPMEKKAAGKSPDQFYQLLARERVDKPVDRAIPEC